MASTNLRRQDYVLNAHLQQAWRRATTERLDAYLCVEREQRIFSLILECDPTTERKYGTWLSAWRRRQWPDLGLRYMCSSQELQDVAAGLEHFHRVRGHLPREHRDIGRLRSAAELLNVEGLLPRESWESLRAAERRRAYAESTVLFESGAWKLIQLHTKEASQWWGRGTRWCTAARSGNQFHAYVPRGELLVIVAPNGKFQLATATGEFRDAADARAWLPKVLRTAPQELSKLLEPYLCRSRGRE